MSQPDPSGVPAQPIAENSSPAAAPESRTARWVAVAILALAATAIAWRFISQAQPTERARLLLADLGAELHDRALTEAELGALMEVDPKALDRGATPTLRGISQGKDVIFLHFWATWCPPCLEELPEIAALASSLQGTRCELAAVSYDDDWAAVRETLAKTLGPAAQPKGRWLRDPQGQDGDPAKMLRLFLGTEKLPETWVIVQGRVAARFIAGQNWTETRMRRAIALLCPPAAGSGT